MTLSSPKTLLIIGYVWPEPNSSAAGTRMMQLINLFKQREWEITFASPANLGEHKENLAIHGVSEQNIALNDSSFDEFVKQLSPGLVIFDRFMMEEQFGWRVEQHAPQALRILNTEDLHALRQCRQNQIKQYLKSQPNEVDLTELALTDQAWLFKNMAKSDIAKREIASIFRCDLTLMISEFEITLLQEQFQVPKRQLHYLPFLYDQINTKKLPTFEERAHFVTIGNFRHDPNWDAVLWLKESIWPKIRQQLPKAELHVYGAYPPPKATALNNPNQGFLVKGWAANSSQVIQNARVLLAPLRFGAGIKGKLAEAMLNGTPNVTTVIGTESMLASNCDHWPGMVANDSCHFANSAVSLYEDYQAWSKYQTIGFKNVLQLYVKNELTGVQKTVTNSLNIPTASSQGDDFLQKLEVLINNLDHHRNQNFIGSMLNHHHHKSTQYMAQWIEAKNKLPVSDSPIN